MENLRFKNFVRTFFSTFFQFQFVLRHKYCMYRYIFMPINKFHSFVCELLYHFIIFVLFFFVLVFHTYFRASALFSFSYSSIFSFLFFFFSPQQSIWRACISSPSKHKNEKQKRQKNNQKNHHQTFLMEDFLKSTNKQDTRIKPHAGRLYVIMCVFWQLVEFVPNQRKWAAMLRERRGKKEQKQTKTSKTNKWMM